MHQKVLFTINSMGAFEFIIAKTLFTALFHSLCEALKLTKRHIIDFISLGKGKNDEADSALLHKVLHKSHLVCMKVLQRKRVLMTFLGIETNRNPLHYSHIVHSGLPVKVGKGNLLMTLIQFYRSNRGRYFLNEGEVLFPIEGNSLIQLLFQKRAS